MVVLMRDERWEEKKEGEGVSFLILPKQLPGGLRSRVAVLVGSACGGRSRWTGVVPVVGVVGVVGVVRMSRRSAVGNGGAVGGER
jgi:hypothetical protein